MEHVQRKGWFTMRHLAAVGIWTAVCSERRFLESTEAKTAEPEVVQSASLSATVPDFPAECHSLLRIIDGFFKSAQMAVSTTDTGKHPCLGQPVLGLPRSHKSDTVDVASVDQVSA